MLGQVRKRMKRTGGLREGMLNQRTHSSALLKSSFDRYHPALGWKVGLPSSPNGKTTPSALRHSSSAPSDTRSERNNWAANVCDTTSTLLSCRRSRWSTSRRRGARRDAGISSISCKVWPRGVRGRQNQTSVEAARPPMFAPNTAFETCRSKRSFDVALRSLAVGARRARGSNKFSSVQFAAAFVCLTLTVGNKRVNQYSRSQW